jgi:hypothetical protein
MTLFLQKHLIVKKHKPYLKYGMIYQSLEIQL